ncbi:MAG: stage V sporulation protein AC [Clostridia bacterium]|nr:stage V sporulation protein AC [Clostridia bacterium]
MTKQKDEKYQKLVHAHTPHSRMLRGCLRAFWVGGLICCVGQALNQLGGALGLTVDQQPMFTSSVLVFLGTTLTGIGVYDVIGKYAGAGSIVPITGFANSVAAPAIEFRREGLVMGVGAKLFTLAGPVLTYGITASVAVGLIYWIIGMVA